MIKFKWLINFSRIPRESKYNFLWNNFRLDFIDLTTKLQKCWKNNLQTVDLCDKSVGKSITIYKLYMGCILKNNHATHFGPLFLCWAYLILCLVFSSFKVFFYEFSFCHSNHFLTRFMILQKIGCLLLR
jgi:hypothetical protein